MIPTVKTVTFIEELVQQNSAPVKFLCDDFSSYYCKSRLTNPDDDFLVYEFIGSRLARHFGIATPEIAWIQFGEDAMGSNYFTKNFNVENGNILFGSKDVGVNDHLDKTGKFRIKNTKQFAKLSNPEDLLKITLMDIHVNNADRNEQNYNLLIQTKEKRFYAIDHSAIFGGPAMKGRFLPKGEPSLGQKLLGSYLLKNVLKFLSFEKVEYIIESYFSSCTDQLGKEVGLIFESLPDSWVVSTGLKDRCLDYILDKTRLSLLKILIIDRFYELKKKK